MHIVQRLEYTIKSSPERQLMGSAHHRLESSIDLKIIAYCQTSLAADAGAPAGSAGSAAGSCKTTRNSSFARRSMFPSWARAPLSYSALGLGLCVRPLERRFADCLTGFLP
jgi:hypothetical protein